MAGLRPLPASVKEAHAGLRAAGIVAARASGRSVQAARAARPRRWWRAAAAGPTPALALRDVWFEVEDGPAILRGISPRAAPRASASR